jgi:predicted alpha/beta-fold hydrolase
MGSFFPLGRLIENDGAGRGTSAANAAAVTPRERAMTEADTRIKAYHHGSNSLPEFEPLFRNPHVQTVLAHLWPRRLDTVRFPVERRLVQTEPDVRVLVEIQRPEGASRGPVVLVHGLESSAQSGYMLGMSQAALEAGFAAARFNLRTCGGTEHLSTTLYHSGLTSDLLAFLRTLGEAAHLVGFSLGGNVVLKLAGELGEEAGAVIRSVCAVSTPIDLSASCHRIARRENRLYERRFVGRMCRRLAATGRYNRADFSGVRSVRDVDERVTAPAFGFRDAEHYYTTQSAAGYLDRVRVPALLIQARDDTFVPFSSFDHPAIARNPHIRLHATAHGGHLGFLARGRNRFWLEIAVVEWISRIQGTSGPELPSSN